MGISVALCTYNGAQFILEQLQSITDQSVPPDEIIICDDNSNDDTCALIESFINTLDRAMVIRMIRNKTNLGSTKNFEQAISLCSGEIIFLADQDDVWQRNKIEKILPRFQNPKVGCVFSDATIVDESLHPLPYTLWQSVRFSQKRQQQLLHRPFQTLLNHRIITGATMAIRSSTLAYALPIAKEWIHDAWLVTIIATHYQIEFINEPLIDYRQHAGNQIGGVRRSLFERISRAKEIVNEDYLEHAKMYRIILQKIKSIDKTERYEKLVRAKINHLEIRGTLPKFRLNRVPPILKEAVLLRYHRCSFGWMSILQDLFLRRN